MCLYILQHMTVHNSENKRRRMYNDFHDMKTSSGMLCVGPARTRDMLSPCLGAPGAPLVVGARLAGLLSWGFGCAYTGDLPLVYTNIKHYVHWLVYNVPKLRSLTKSNVTELFYATKVYLITQWLVKTRIKEPEVKKLPLHDIHAIDIDKQLCELSGNVYDVRDFINGGMYQPSKANMYRNLRLAEKKKYTIEKIASRRVLKGKAFLSIGEGDDVDFVVRNSSLYEDDADDEQNGDQDMITDDVITK